MSRTSDWHIELQQKHADNECDSKCIFCRDEYTNMVHCEYEETE